MAKIERKYLAHYINTAEHGEPAAYERIGKGLEEFSPVLNARVEKKRDILGSHTVTISGYEKTGKVQTLYADPNTQLFDRLQNIIQNGYVMDKLRTSVVEVRLWEQETDGKYPGVEETAYIEVLGYGGDSSGYHISFMLHYTGTRSSGMFDINKKTFTAG